MAEKKVEQVVKKVPEVAEKKSPVVNPNQPVETNAYVPTYKVRPELKQAILNAIGKYPFNKIAQIMQAINVEVMDHNTLTQVINVLGNFPYQDVASLLGKINDFVEQVVED